MGKPEFFVAVLDTISTFWSTVIGHVLSWPVAVFVAVLIFRKPLRGLIERIRRLKTPVGDVLIAELAGLNEEIDETAREIRVNARSSEEARLQESADPKTSEEESDTGERQREGAAKRDASALASLWALRKWSVSRDANFLDDSEPSLFDPPARLLLGDPARIVHIAWKRLSETLYSIEAAHPDPDRTGEAGQSGSAVEAAYGLVERKIIDQSLYDGIITLANVRRLLDVSGEPVSLPVARQYYRAAIRLSSIAAATTTRSTAKRDEGGE